MQKAAFSILKYSFDKVSIDLSNYKSLDLKLQFDTSGVYVQTESVYSLVFTVKAFCSEKIDSNFIEIRCIGVFKFEEPTDFENIPDFFYRNCIAILFPYVRAFVSMVTIQANVPPVMLPTLNLSALEDVLKQNTQKQ